MKHEEIISIDNKEICNANKISDQEKLTDVKNNDNRTEIINENQKSFKDIKNNSVSDDNQDSELNQEINLNDVELTINNTVNTDLENIIENNNEVNNLTKDENCDIEQLKELKTNDIIVLKVNENCNLNISEEIKILNDAVENNSQMDNVKAEEYLPVNGEISLVKDENTQNNFDRLIENHITTSKNNTETKHIEIQNNLNTLLNENLNINVTEKEDNEISVVTDTESNEEIKVNRNGNVANQDSISSSSDSETIINSECVPYEINGDNVEISEQKPVIPISVITIQTCDTVDSDCSEAYLTPNELNDTPKKVIEKNTNYHINVVSDNVVPQLNPSVDINNDIEIPSKHLSEAIIEQQINEDIVHEIKDNIKTIEENIIKAKENNDESPGTDNKIEIDVADKVQENVDTIVQNIDDIEDNHKELEIEQKENLNIALQPHEEGILCPEKKK